MTFLDMTKITCHPQDGVTRAVCPPPHP